MDQYSKSVNEVTLEFVIYSFRLNKFALLKIKADFSGKIVKSQTL